MKITPDSMQNGNIISIQVQTNTITEVVDLEPVPFDKWNEILSKACKYYQSKDECNILLSALKEAQDKFNLSRTDFEVLKKRNKVDCMKITPEPIQIPEPALKVIPEQNLKPIEPKEEVKIEVPKEQYKKELKEESKEQPKEQSKEEPKPIRKILPPEPSEPIEEKKESTSNQDSDPEKYTIQPAKEKTIDEIALEIISSAGMRNLQITNNVTDESIKMLIKSKGVNEDVVDVVLKTVIDKLKENGIIQSSMTENLLSKFKRKGKK